MTTPKARQPKGSRTGGQFAESTHQEAAVQLTAEEQRQEDLRAERERPLTVQEVEYLARDYGTYDADLSRMPKVLEAAAEKAANTDEGRLVLRRRAQAEQLAQYTGIPAREIRSFFEEVEYLEPMSEGWENLVQTYSQYVWNRPRGEVIHVEDKMRKVHGRPSRDELIAQRDALTAQIDALSLNDAAAAIRRKHPTAAFVEAVEEYPDAVKLTCWDQDGKELGEVDSKDIPELSSFDLIPMNYDAERSPLRTCVEPGDDLYRRTYIVDKMAALTADDLLQP
jgi:hypothetical protein